MKNRLWRLYLAQLNVHYGWSAGKYYYIKKRQRTWEPVLITLSLAPAVAMVVYFLWRLTETLFLAGLSFGQPHLALVNGSLLASILGLFFGFFYVLSAFYFSSDLAVLVPLPLRSWEILAAKLGVVLTGQYVMNALLLLPIWIRYGLLARTGWSYALSGVVVFITLPIIPLVIASLVSVLLMRLVNLSRHRDKLTLIGGILLLVVVLGFQFWLQSSLSTGDPDLVMQELLGQVDGLVSAVGRVFPPSVWAAQGMAYSHSSQGALNLLYLVLASVIALGILYLLGERVFMQGLLSGLEGSRGSGRKRRTGDIKVQPVFLTLVSTERKLFVRDPGFALNGLVGYVIFPVLFVLPLLGQNIEGIPLDALTLLEMPPFFVMGGIALFFMGMTAMSMIPSTTFSREGSYLWIVRSLPLTIGEIIATRVAAAQVVNTVGCVIGVLPVAYVFGWGAMEVLGGVVLGILLATALAFLLVLFDLRRPMLDWVNPIKAVKSNLNAMVGLVLAAVLIFALGALLYFNVKTQTLWLIPLELLAAAGLLGFVAHYLVKHVAPKLWRRI